MLRSLRNNYGDPVIKLIIAGGRKFNNLKLMVNSLTEFLPTPDETTVISGMARGADILGVVVAKANSLPIIQMPADWDKYGKSAGHIRNEEMAKIATHALIFWDGKSRGTRSMIRLSEQYKLITKVIRY